MINDNTIHEKWGDFVTFMSSQNRHMDTLIVAVALFLILFIILIFARAFKKFPRPNHGILLLYGACVFFIIFIFAYKSVETTLWLDLEVVCNGDALDPGDRGYIITLNNRLYTTLSFVYYYLLIIVRTLVYCMMTYVTLYIIYMILTVNQHLTGISYVASFFESFNVLSPDSALSFMAMWESDILKAHVRVFVLGLVCSILYGVAMIKPHPNICLNDAAKVETSIRFSNGLLIIFTMLVMFYSYEITMISAKSVSS